MTASNQKQRDALDLACKQMADVRMALDQLFMNTMLIDPGVGLLLDIAREATDRAETLARVVQQRMERVAAEGPKFP